MKNWKENLIENWINNDIDIKNKCVGCNSTEHLIKLENGSYACIECLDELALDQNIIKYDIIKILVEHNITKPENQAKTLRAIATVILAENQLLSKENLEKLLNKTEEFNYGKHFNCN